jgi:hypothetical protein
MTVGAHADQNLHHRGTLDLQYLVRVMTRLPRSLSEKLGYQEGPALIGEALAEQRRRFVELRDGLPPTAWDSPSRCAGWSVHDVTGRSCTSPCLRDGPRRTALSGSTRAPPGRHGWREPTPRRPPRPSLISAGSQTKKPTCSSVTLVKVSGRGHSDASCIPHRISHVGDDIVIEGSPDADAVLHGEMFAVLDSLAGRGTVVEEVLAGPAGTVRRLSLLRAVAT